MKSKAALKQTYVWTCKEQENTKLEILTMIAYMCPG